ncbi:hypothetical protein CPB83DRAFT_832363 [Crepidotus variabilis]|uniref:Uncharacterized protein n=1 Tax=Crepidotus variabilis TaxID=179855 RepID=A0A9P6JTM6_9AGAR|nr:hypothetical protein CPB83DRAFT_832363 [Crepidotus variabilis]
MVAHRHLPTPCKNTLRFRPFVDSSDPHLPSGLSLSIERNRTPEFNFAEHQGVEEFKDISTSNSWELEKKHSLLGEALFSFSLTTFIKTTPAIEKIKVTESVQTYYYQADKPARDAPSTGLSAYHRDSTCCAITLQRS